MEVEELEKLVKEANDCLVSAARNENRHPEELLNIKAARSMFTHYYGKLILMALEQIVEEQKHEEQTLSVTQD